ncbi:MAG: hypothetical protein ACLFPI_02560 [Desulfobacterales bacterium]
MKSSYIVSVFCFAAVASLLLAIPVLASRLPDIKTADNTVKTYMHRVYEKVGVNGKKELFEKFNDL